MGIVWRENWQWRAWLWRSVGAIAPLFGAIALLPDCVSAQPVADTTLGAEQSIVTPFSPAIDRIDGGATRGINLFHSFRAFNIGAGRGAYFFVPSAAIQNVLARVTGTNRSEILGILGVRNLINNTLLPSNANLFLMNPNGIIFGPGASLDVGGSFVATTANAIQFGNGAEFSTNSSVDDQNPLLRINPSAFLFNQIPGRIENRSVADVGVNSNGGTTTGLKVPDGRSLVLLGGDVLVDGSGLNAFGGRVEVGGVAGVGRVNLDNSLRLEFLTETPRANVSIINGSRIDTIASGGGDINIYADQFDLIGGSSISTGIGIGLGANGRRAGEINVNATGTILIADGSGILSGVVAGIGSAGRINISGQSVKIISNSNSTSQVSSVNLGDGDAGAVSIRARDSLSFEGGAVLTIVASSLTLGSPLFAGTGNGGDINLEARTIILSNATNLSTNNIFAQGKSGSVKVFAHDDFSVQDGSFISTRTQGQGDAGDILIRAGNQVRLDGINANGVGSSLNSTVEQVPNFDFLRPRTGGEIRIEAGSLLIANGASINSSTSGQGNAGGIVINVRNAAILDGANRNGSAFVISSQVDSNAIGNGGNLTFSAGSLSVTNGAQLSSSTFGLGDAGDLTITVHDAAVFDGVGSNGFSSAAGSQVAPNAVGNGGNLTFSAGSLSVTNGAFLSTSTVGQGSAGNLTITVRDGAVFDGVGSNGFSSGVYSEVAPNAVGNGGSLTLSANSLSITNRAIVSSSTSGQGNAGDIVIETQQLFVREAQVAAATFGKGDAGNIFLIIRDLFQADNGTISTSATQSSGGAIAITAKDIRLNGDSDITTFVGSGVGGGGNITLTANSIIALNDSDILSFAQDGVGGNITLNTRAFFGQNYRPAPFGTDPRTLDGNSRVDVNASGAVSGIVTLPDVTFIQNSLTQLPQVPIDTNALLANSCIVRRNQPTGNFFITGSGGLPERPGTAASPTFPTGEVQNVEDSEVRSQKPEVKIQNSNLSTQNSSARRPWKIGDPIAEPDSVYQLPDGQLVLSHECR